MENESGFLPTCKRCKDWLPTDAENQAKNFNKVYGKVLPEAKYDYNKCENCNVDSIEPRYLFMKKYGNRSK